MAKRIFFRSFTHILVVFFCFFSLFSVSQTSWDWSKNIHSTSENIGYSKLCISNSNNVFLSGDFSDMINIDGNNYYGNDLSTAFVASFLPNGQLQWFKKSGEPLNYNLSNNIQVENLFSMPNNDIVLFGSYSYNLVFDGLAIHDHQHHPNGSDPYPIFAFRFNSNGNPISTINITSYRDLVSPASCIDNSGNIYISALYNDSVFINNSDTLLPSVTSSVFIAKFNSSDSLINIIDMNSSSSFFMTDIQCDQNGNIIICGKAGNMISINGDQIGYNNTQYSFIAKLDNSGNLIGWLGSSQADVADIEIISDKIYFTGILHNDSIRFHNTYTVYPDLNYNVLFGYAPLSLDTIIFQTNLGQGNGVKLLGGLNESIYLNLEKYYFIFDPFFGELPLPNFKVIKLTAEGTTIWSAESTVNSYMSSAFDMAMTPFDDLLITGIIGDSIGFGADVYSNTSGQSLYLAKLNQISNINFNGNVYNNSSSVANAQVEFLRFEGNATASPVGSCFTDNSGHYTYNDSITGNYYIRAIPDISLPGSALTYPSSSVQWFSSTGNQVSGDTIIITDINLSQLGSDSGPNSIHGYIKDPFGNPLSQIKVNLTNNAGVLFEATLTDNLGYYSFNSVSNSNFNVLVDQPFLPLLNSYTPADYSLDYNYMVFSNFIDTGSQYLPQPTDTIGIYISNCVINPSLPIDSAFAYVIGYTGSNNAVIYLQIYQLQNFIDTIIEVPYSEIGLNVLLVNLSCDMLKILNNSNLQFLLLLDPLLSNNIINLEEDFRIYPNPCYESLSVITKSNSSILGYEIFDYTGKTIASFTANSEHSLTVPVSNFSKGYYIIKLNFNSGCSKFLTFTKN
jgi:hypothetical protein